MVFLKNLDYWISRGEYGREYDGKIWIYNTLDQWAEQLGVSKSTARRCIKRLRDAGIIQAEYLSYNKRNRTLFYTINREKASKMPVQNVAGKRLKNQGSDVLKNPPDEHMDEHMGEHMYIHIHSQKIHKSYKSDKSGDNISRDTVSRDSVSGKNFSGKAASRKSSLRKSSPRKLSSKKLSPRKTHTEKTQEHNEKLVKEVITEQVPKVKPTTVQDMIKSLYNIHPGIMKSFKLSKEIARNLMAAFQRKFNETIEAWEKYLRLIKTSAYIMGEKFKLTVEWLLKFKTIDRILDGELGVNPDKITYTEKEKQEMDEQKKQQMKQEINEADEPEIYKQARIKMLDTIKDYEYRQYFTDKNLCRFVTRDDAPGQVIVELLGNEPWDFIYIKEKLKEIDVQVEWINDHVTIKLDNGETELVKAKSFEEFEKLQLKKYKYTDDDEIRKSPIWQRISKIIESEENPKNKIVTNEPVNKRPPQVQKQISAVSETETCKQARLKTLDILGADKYRQYFANSNRCRFVERDNVPGQVIVELLGNEPWDFLDLMERVGLEYKWFSEFIDIDTQNGYESVTQVKSLNELDAIKSLGEDAKSNRSTSYRAVYLWKKIKSVLIPENLTPGLAC